MPEMRRESGPRDLVVRNPVQRFRMVRDGLREQKFGGKIGRRREQARGIERRFVTGQEVRIIKRIEIEGAGIEREI